MTALAQAIRGLQVAHIHSIKPSVLSCLVLALGACSAQPAATDDTASADGAKSKIQCPDGTTVAWNKTCPAAPTSPVVSVPATTAVAGAVAYDTAIGMGVDNDGFAMLPLRSGARRFFVRNGGNDALNCAQAQNPATPLATVGAGVACLTAGNGDQLLLGEGSTFKENIPLGGDAHGWLAAFSGYSAAYPTVFSSYDPSDPLNEAKYGRGDQRGARPVLTRPSAQVGNGTYSNIAIRGLDFNPGNIAGVGLVFVGKASNILIENNIFRYTGLSFDAAEAPSVIPTTQKIIVRNNSLYGMWSTGGRTGGLYVAGYDGATVEDNIFYHNGWKIGASRDDDPSLGGATVFSHSYYLQTNTTGSVVRRNLSADGAGDGGIARGDSVFSENLFIDNPAAIGVGGGPTYNVDRPKGVKFDVGYNAIIGDADVNSTHPLGWAINTTNGQQGSRVHHNLIVRSRNVNGPAMGGFSNNAAFNQPSYAQYDHNLMWSWVSQTAQLYSYYSSCGAFPTQCFSTYDSNSWDGIAQGTNTNSAGTAFANPYTASQMYVALGYADKNAFINYMINHPEAHLQRNARAMLFTGYGM